MSATGVFPTLTPWYALPDHWRDASGWMRLRTLLPPLVIPAVLCWQPLIGIALAGMVVLVGCLIVLGRLSLQWFRRDRRTRLTAWRLPLSLLIALLSIKLAIASYEQAKVEARDLIVELHESGSYGRQGLEPVCDAVEACTVDLGYPLIGFPAWVSRHEFAAADGPTSEFRVLMSLGPDDVIRFTASEHEGVHIVHHADVAINTLDPATLQVVSVDSP